MTKAELRRHARAARGALTADAPVTVAAAFLDRLRPGLVVASYVPVGSEADPSPLARSALAACATLALPHVVDRATPLRFLVWHGAETLHPGPFGLHQPHATAAEVAPSIILAPLLAFDRAGGRLGQGAGHYDRAFAAHPAAWRVGVAWAGQEVASVPTDTWDVPLHAVATEREWIAIA